MAMAASAIVSFSSYLCCVRSPPPRKGKKISLSLITERSYTSAASRLSLDGAGKRMPNFALFSSNSDQKPDEAEGSELSDEALLPPDDVDYLWKLVAGSVGGGAVVKYGSILFPGLTRPNLVQALLMVSVPVLVAAAILIKESYSAPNEDLY